MDLDSVFLLSDFFINLEGDLGNLIFHTQAIIEWSLKQSDITPALKNMSECETSIHSRRDWVAAVTLVGSVISWVRFQLLNISFVFIRWFI